MWKRVIALWKLFRHDLRLVWFALRHPATPVGFKLGVLAVLAYVVSPVDFIPDVIPVLGQLDDVLVLSFGLKWLLGLLPVEVLQAAGQGKVAAETELAAEVQATPMKKTGRSWLQGRRKADVVDVRAK